MGVCLGPVEAADVGEVEDDAEEGEGKPGLSQMVPAMDMVASARFFYSAAALVPWSDAELDTADCTKHGCRFTGRLGA